MANAPKISAWWAKSAALFSSPFLALASDISAYTSLMFFLESLFKYFSLLPSVVARTLPEAPNPDVPFFLDDPVILNYEVLRAVWVQSASMSSVCDRFHRSKAEFHRLERSLYCPWIARHFSATQKPQSSP